MTDPTPIKILCLGGETVEFPEQFQDFADLIKHQDLDEPIPVAHSKETIEIIKRFFEVHEWKREKIIVEKPLKDEKLELNLDKESYEVLKPFKGIDNIEKMRPLVEAGYYLNCELFKDACLATLASEFYVGSTEQDLDNFKKKHSIKDLTPDEELDIMKEFSPVFEQLNKKFQEEIENEQKKLVEQQQQQQSAQQQGTKI